MPHSTRLGQFLPYLLSITANTVSGRLSQEYRARFGLTVPEWRVLAVLGDSGPRTQRQLCRMTIMDKVAVNRACKELERRALARRQPNEDDGRSHHLELTDEGREVHTAIMPLALELERRLFASFAEEEVATFREMLARIREQVEDLNVEDIDFGHLV